MLPGHIVWKSLLIMKRFYSLCFLTLLSVCPHVTGRKCRVHLLNRRSIESLPFFNKWFAWFSNTPNAATSFLPIISFILRFFIIPRSIPKFVRSTFHLTGSCSYSHRQRYRQLQARPGGAEGYCCSSE
uniref:Secreted protein n=1 Tax=Cacopsylla melanoneura TaxID=428564 RepID=A0A8D8RPD7_9HEMI